MSTADEVKRLVTARLPVIDISKLSSANAADHMTVAEDIRRACVASGFFYVVGHGIPQGLSDAVLLEARALFDQPLERKLSVDISRSICNRGYEVLRRQTLERGAPADLKEGFYIGLELSDLDPRVIARRFNRGPNLWPSDLPGFRPTMQAYFAAMLELGERLMRGLALSLSCQEDYFSAFTHDPLSGLRLLHYPPQPEVAVQGEKGAGAHTDFGSLTVLLQDQVGGLQVWEHKERVWIDAVPVRGSYIVNLGDLIARWTNDRYRSTLHRVINQSGLERYSVPFFYMGNPDQRVECIQSCLDAGSSPKYLPTTVEEHLVEMYRQTYN